MVQGDGKSEIVVDTPDSQSQADQRQEPGAVLAAIAEQRKATLWFVHILTDKLRKAGTPTVQLVQPVVPRLRWLHALTGRPLQVELITTGWSIVCGRRPYGIREARPHFIRQGLFVSQEDGQVFQYVSLVEPPELNLAAAPGRRQLPVLAHGQFGERPEDDFMLWKRPPQGNPLDCREPYRDIFWDDPETRRQDLLNHGMKVEAALQRYIEQLALDKR